MALACQTLAVGLNLPPDKHRAQVAPDLLVGAVPLAVLSMDLVREMDLRWEGSGRTHPACSQTGLGGSKNMLICLYYTH